MKDYAKNVMELAPRDIVARSIQHEVDSGRGFENEYVHLDLTHLGEEKIKERLPGIRQIAIDFAGVDPIEKPIPVQPGQHYSMGGISTDSEAKTELPGLFAAGECACVSVHGANRLGGNSLLEAVVYGKIVGAVAADYMKDITIEGTESVNEALKSEITRIDGLRSRTDGERTNDIKEELTGMMFKHFGVFRDGKQMEAGLKKLKDLQDRSKNIFIGNKGMVFNQALLYALELEGMLEIAEAVCIGAAERKESRGSHSRIDYESRNDDKFLKHSMVYYRDNKAVLEYSDVKLGKFPVKERVY
jgi:succinate dehydrogenase / fumarate reductase flavoprotein subunit